MKKRVAIGILGLADAVGWGMIPYVMSLLVWHRGGGDSSFFPSVLISAGILGATTAFIISNFIL